MLISPSIISLRGKSLLLLLLLLLLVGQRGQAQQAVQYSLSFENAVHHEAEVTVVFPELKEPTLEVRMSRTSPGRYALHEFAKNVYNVRVTDGQGKQLVYTRPNLHQWNISGHDGTVRVTYTLFGDHASGTYTGIDATHAHLNMPATLLYARSLEKRPARVVFRVPTGSNWQVATQLKPEKEPFTFSAPNLAYLLDSPTELSAFSLREWPVTERGKTYTIRLAVHHEGTEGEVDEFAGHARRIVQEARAVFGELPDFDFGTYTFIACYMPHAIGDGMEHRNSTFLTSSRPLGTHSLSHLSTLTHEFFHAWNVERIRPRSLEPFNLEEASMSGELWFAEGFTNYYSDLIMTRAGLYTPTAFARQTGNALQTVLLSPARQYYSPVEMSQQAPFVDAARSVDAQNRVNTYISYYTYGSVLGLALDLALRNRPRPLTLDSYMRRVWEAHGKPEKPYTLSDLQRLLAEETKDEKFAADFFNRYIHGRELPDFAALLRPAGLLLRPAQPGRASIGPAYLDELNGQLVVEESTLVGSPLYQAGVSREDQLLRLGTTALSRPEDMQKALQNHKPGDQVELTYRQRGREKKTIVTLIENPQVELVPMEATNQPLPKSAAAFRKGWLSPKAATKKEAVEAP